MLHLRRFAAVTVVAALLGLLPLAAASAAEFAVAVEDFQFSPQEVFVNAGDTVTWTWEGEAPHNVTPVEDGAFEAAPTQTEGTFSVTFDEPGAVPYFCSIHSDGESGMVGIINVLPAGEPLPEPAPEPRPAPEPGTLPAATDNIGAALAWSSLFADGSAPTALLGRDDLFADSLSSGGVQGLLDAPLLLTFSDSLDLRVAMELDRLGTQSVIIFGGVAAVSQEVEDSLVELGYAVDRVSGATRLETANDAAATFFPDARRAYLVRSREGAGGDATQAFADSLGVGGAAARDTVPVLLTETEALPQATASFLQGSAIDRVTVVGGTAAVSAQVEADLGALGIDVERISGPTRFDTAAELASDTYGEPSLALLVEGQAADAWASGFAAASAAESAPILLANGDALPAATLEIFSFGVQVLCGPLVGAAACEQARIAGSSPGFGAPGTLVAALSGAAEVPTPGPDGPTGDASVNATSDPGTVCYDYTVYGLDQAVTGAHIHEAPEGEAGDVVIPLALLREGNFVRSCAFGLDPALVADVLANPADYYVNVHTEQFPAGALRGQLFEAEIIGLAELTADAEVPPTDAQGGAFWFGLTDADDHTRLCYFFGYELAEETVVAAHIHAAPEGDNGDVVHTLQVPPAGVGEGTVCDDADAALVEQLLADPAGFYVNLHTQENPDGALRGQIINPFAGPPPGEEGGQFAAARRS